MSDSSVRRAAHRVGLVALKSRQRTNVPNLDNFGDYMLVDAETHFVVAGARFDMSAEGVLQYCAARREAAESEVRS